jgi:hypothetical protein
MKLRRRGSRPEFPQQFEIVVVLPNLMLNDLLGLIHGRQP